jgi:DNA topoisomerase I
MGNISLVIVESPTKAKTIARFLSKDYIVRASMGHVRDLPASAEEIPLKYKKEKWARVGVNVDKNFEPLYIIPKKKKDQVKELQDLLKKADILYLATDEDREGESISWHLQEILNPKIPTKRLVFHEITKEAIQHALETAREIDTNLVHAQETRRVIDRLFGYEVSPLLWKKMAPGLSAGRVQSVAIRLLVERERARMKFIPADFWGMKGMFLETKTPQEFQAELFSLSQKRVALGKDFDAETGKLPANSDLFILNEAEALKLVAELKAGKTIVKSVDEKPFTSRPYPPFVTSSLQQDSNAKLKLSARRTMQVAQQLYENGFITYMRTDSTTLSEQAILAARNLIEERFGKAYVPSAPRQYQTKVKNAQEAHEAIRPAGEKFTDPEVVRAQLGDEAARVYDLIYKRTLASQMNDAKGTQVSVVLENGRAQFRTSGRTYEFQGFLKAYEIVKDNQDEDDEERTLPKLQPGQEVQGKEFLPSSHTTQPPSRYSEGSLIKELERLGIGRPSTWASIVELVLNRSYAFKKGNALCPTFVSMALVALLEDHFTQFLDYEFTAHLEDDLDAISRGEIEGSKYLNKFYFGNGHPGLKTLVEKGEKDIDPRLVCGVGLSGSHGVVSEKPEDGSEPKKLEVRIGRYGLFLTDGEKRVGLPDELTPDEMTPEKAIQLLIDSARDEEPLGYHPITNEPVFLKIGRFGPYVQLGVQPPIDPNAKKAPKKKAAPKKAAAKKGAKKKKGEEVEELVEDTTLEEAIIAAPAPAKPKMASLLPNTAPADVTLEHALKLLELPKELGIHPQMEVPVIVANGRFGPYVKAGAETRSIPLDIYSPIELNLNDALLILAEPKKNGRVTRKPSALREIGVDPKSGKNIQLFSGRFGPYVADGEVNASIPRGVQPDSVTLDDAVRYLTERREKIAIEGPSKKKGKRAKKK